jgi:type VI secretion system secreted protein Hcp
MSNDVFIKIDGITGESQDAAHPDEIQVENWTWKLSQRSSMMSGSGGGAGKATVEDLVFFHKIDRASPNLMSYCLTGKHIPKTILTMRKAGGVPFDFFRITLSDVIVTGVEMSASYEQVRLLFAKVQQEYMVQMHKAVAEALLPEPSTSRLMWPLRLMAPIGPTRRPIKKPLRASRPKRFFSYSSRMGERAVCRWPQTSAPALGSFGS